MSDSITPISIEQELEQSYLDYAMSVIVGRALPDVRDGLKPVHRRVLFAMRELGNDWNKPYKKSARVVGDVIGKYHPHGDSAVYQTMVRMAQPFSLRYLLVDGQGNFGSVDGDAPAAMRYTEVRMSKLAHSLMLDLDKETVDFSPNYDESEMIPDVFPTRVPNLLVNGTAGIAVGMATNIPPHNMKEVIDGCLLFIDQPECSIDDLIAVIPGPDLPTAGIIYGRSGIRNAYQTGRGRMYMRARTQIENPEGKKERIIVHELPYQVNKAKLIEKIAFLVKNKQLEGISALRDESDKDGMRIVIEIRRGDVAEVVLNNLFAQTQMQTVFGINMVALLDNQPKLLNLKQVIQAFVHHRQEVVTRRTIYLLRKARERAHILEGLAIALANIDEMIALIKSSASPSEAKKALLAKKWQPGSVNDMLSRLDNIQQIRPEGLSADFGLVNGVYQLSTYQVDAILELKLHRLTGLEQDKIFDEFKGIIEKIADLLDILNHVDRLMSVIKEELIEIKENFGDERRTEILEGGVDLTLEDLITQEDMVVTLSQKGYVKSQPVSDYQSQRRGGRGKSATQVKEEDYIINLAVCNTHDHLLCFSTRGKVYWMKTYQLPQAGRGARGRPINNILPIEEDEKITALLSVKDFKDDQFVFMATASGTVKKTSLSAFSKPRNGGIRALDLAESDELIGVQVTDGAKDIMLFSDGGKVAHFSEADVRAMGRTARGVRGIRLQKDQVVISMIVVDSEDSSILTATENGYGKQTPASEYRKIHRGGQGVVSIKTSERNGKVVNALCVGEDEEVMLLTDGGTLVRTRVNEISTVGRNTQGVRLINLAVGEHLIGMQSIPEIDETVESNGAGDGIDRSVGEPQPDIDSEAEAMDASD